MKPIKHKEYNRRRQIAAIVAGVLVLIMVLSSAIPFFFGF